ncbi:MAG: lamin tail domain-containing protein [archaeon]|nr:lamin tail domain-containing protein [archaeon]
MIIFETVDNEGNSAIRNDFLYTGKRSVLCIITGDTICYRYENETFIVHPLVSNINWTINATYLQEENATYNLTIQVIIEDNITYEQTYSGIIERNTTYSQQFTVPTPIVINEVYPHPNATQEPKEEWIEIYNPGPLDVNLTGWRIKDGDGELNFTIPESGPDWDGILEADSYLVFHIGDTLDTPAEDIYGFLTSGVLSDNKDSDSVSLLTPEDVGVDFVRYGNCTDAPPAGTAWTGINPDAPLQGQSLGRDRDSTDTDDGSDWENTGGIDADGPTPGRRNLIERYIFDTGFGTYPSIMGTHNGTIRPSHDVIVNRMFTYPCAGTGGHSENVRFYNDTWSVEANWTGYQGAADYHYIVFDNSFTLKAGVDYNYIIKTGSYPQIHHNRTLAVQDGEITCTSFVDANGKRYDDWIPAIKLE